MSISSTWWGGNNYSTEEQVVGIWIDGKPLYQKTYNFGSLPNSTSKELSSGLTNVNIVNIFGISRGTDILGMPLPRATSDGTYTIDLTYRSDNKIRVTTANSWSGYDTTYITLQYTKTTD